MVTWEKSHPHSLTGNDAKGMNEIFLFPIRGKPEIEVTSSSQAKAEDRNHLSPSEAAQGISVVDEPTSPHGLFPSCLVLKRIYILESCYRLLLRQMKGNNL